MRHTTRQLFTFGITGTAIITSTLYFSVKYIIRGAMERSDIAVEARLLSYNNQEVKRILGTPIKEGRVDPFDFKKNHNNGYEAIITIPVKGTNTHGSLYCEAKRLLKSGDWAITKLQLKAGDGPDTILDIIEPEASD